MGLDCYVRVTRNAGTEVPGETTEELWYARKLSEVHHWMQQHSGIDAEEFNCERFYLTDAVLAELEQDWQAGQLQPTSGFFFGNPNSRDEVNEAVVLLLIKSKQALAAGEQP
jgi:S-methylmethionine-dependent homocysteine/selenocysteine methylase